MSRSAARRSNARGANDHSRDPITAQGIAALEAEIEQLEGTHRRELAERTRAARDLGDLKENAEYHIAKDDQAHLEARIKRLHDRLSDAVVVENGTGGDTFTFGRTAEVLDEASGSIYRWTLFDSAGGRRTTVTPNDSPRTRQARRS